MRTALGTIPHRLLRDMSMGEAHDYLRARRTRRDFLRDLTTAGLAAAAGPLVWAKAARADGAEPAGLHLGVGDDPRKQFTVSWCTGGLVDLPRLEYGLDTSYGATSQANTRTINGHPTLYHHATLPGLAPDTTYFYRAIHDGAVGTTGQFKTAPAFRSSFRFAAMGDMGATDAGATITQRIEDADPDCVFMVGDLCYADRLGGASEPPPEFPPGTPLQDLGQWDLWFAQIGASASKIPWITTVGNHEMEVGQGTLGYDGFKARIELPGGGAGADSPTYVTRWGNVAFVALDGNDVSYEITKNQGYTGGLQNSWLDTTLGELREDPFVDFIVVGFHHCMYCTNAVHASDGGVRDAWGALFDQHRVDLVINGHNHSYERTHPVLAGAPTADAPIGSEVDTGELGPIYVTAGAGGQAAYPSTLHPSSYVWSPEGQQPETAEWSAVRYAGDHSLLIVDVTPSRGGEPARLDAVALASDGTEVDRFSVVRADSIAVVPSLSPGKVLPLAALLTATGARALRDT